MAGMSSRECSATAIHLSAAIRRESGAPIVAKGVPTYSHDVAAILRAKCEGCHRPGEVAPFSLQTYQQASAHRPAAAAEDPDDKLLWRFPRQRMEAEAIRDSALSVAGLLNTQMFGPSVFPELPKGAWTEYELRGGVEGPCGSHVKRVLSKNQIRSNRDTLCAQTPRSPGRVRTR